MHNYNCDAHASKHLTHTTAKLLLGLMEENTQILNLMQALSECHPPYPTQHANPWQARTFCRQNNIPDTECPKLQGILQQHLDRMSGLRKVQMSGNNKG